MALRRAVVGGLVGCALAAASLAGLGTSGCGGTSVEHVSDGGTGATGADHGGTAGSHGGTGGTGLGGSSHGTPCTTVGSFAGPEFVAWNVSPDSSCEGMDILCYHPSDSPLSTCLDGGIPEPGMPSGDSSPPAPSTTPGCPNVRVLCNTQVGCCESTYTLIAGPELAETPPCCYLAQPGFLPR